MSALLTEFNHAMAQLLEGVTPSHIAVACSGGADSMALSLLAYDWAASNHCRLTALIVDHGLREASAREAEQTALSLKARNITVELLPITVAASDTSLQEKARDARYEALYDWCNQHGASHLLLGHHAGDQAETFLMRLLAKSRFDGLAAMSAKRVERTITLMRPLLHHQKYMLTDYLRSKQQDWVEDPSNQNTQFTRVALRQWIATQQGAQERLVSLAKRFGHLRIQHEARLKACYRHYVHETESGIMMLSNAMFSELPTDEASALLWHIVSVIGVAQSTPRLHKVEALIAQINNAKRHTIGGCVLEHTDKHWLLYIEAARAPKAVSLIAGMNRWGHYSIDWPDHQPGWVMGHLREEDRIAMKEHIEYDHEMTPRSVLSLPAFYHLEELAAVPHIGYYNENWPDTTLKPTFSPAKPLGNWSFFVMT